MSDILHQNKLEEAYELLKDADPRWVNTILRMTRMAAGKGKDYGNDEDNLANLTACKSMGIEPWVGVTIRLRDKEQRIDSYLLKGELANESLEDAIEDAAVYAVHRLTLYREGQNEPTPVKTVPPFPWLAGSVESFDFWAEKPGDDGGTFFVWWNDQPSVKDTDVEDAEYWWPKWHAAGCPS